MKKLPHVLAREAAEAESKLGLLAAEQPVYQPVIEADNDDNSDSDSSSEEEEEEEDLDAKKDKPLLVKLDHWDSHLDCGISDDGLEFAALHRDGFQYLWKAARATHGITGGNYMYEVKIMEYYKCDLPGASSKAKNMVRVGCSLPLSSLFLGDSAESWAYGGTGKMAHDGEFKDFEEAFGVGDVIGVIMDADNLTLSFTKNGRFLGMAFRDMDPAIQTDGMFPHIMLKNVRVEVNFDKRLAWHQPPKNVFFLGDANYLVRVENPVDHPSSQDDCEFLMMTGLPATGKTYWATEYMEENPRDNFSLLGISSVIDQMKVVQPKKREDAAERYDELLVLATPIFKKMCELAAKTTRNVILDQTNVTSANRVSKLQDFLEFGERKAIVVVTDAETLEERTKNREWEEGRLVPEEAVMNMKQNFTLPHVGEGFTHIEYAEATEEEAAEIVKEYNEEGKSYKANGGKKKEPAAEPVRINALDVADEDELEKDRTSEKTEKKRSPIRRSRTKSLSVPKKKKSSSRRKSRTRTRSRKRRRSRRGGSRRRDRSRRRHRSDSRSRRRRRR